MWNKRLFSCIFSFWGRHFWKSRVHFRKNQFLSDSKNCPYLLPFIWNQLHSFMSNSFCVVAKKLTLPPKLNGPVVKLCRFSKSLEGSRVAPLILQNDETITEVPFLWWYLNWFSRNIIFFPKLGYFTPQIMKNHDIY